MNRRQLLGSAVALPSLGSALSVAAAQQKQMRITGVETDLLKPPPGEPFYDALQTLNVNKGSVSPSYSHRRGYHGVGEQFVR